MLSILVIVACGNDGKSRSKSRKGKKEHTEQTTGNTDIENSRAHRFLESRENSGWRNEDNSTNSDDAVETDSEEIDSIPEVVPVEVEEEEPAPVAAPAPAPTPAPQQNRDNNGDSAVGSSTNSTVGSSGDSAGSVSQDRREEARTFLRTSLSAANELMGGSQVDYMTTCDRIEFRNDNAYYYYTIDESQISIATMRSMQDTMRENIRNNLENAAGSELITDRLAILHGKIIYTYTGNQSGESFSISLQY